MLMALNQLSGFPLEKEELHHMAEQLGSDCPFFLNRRIMLAEGRGEILSGLPPVKKSLPLVLLFPGIHMSTAEAYTGIVPKERSSDLADQFRRPVSEWAQHLQNNLEIPLFRIHPQLKSIKEELLATGALFASMTGSGSAIYGLFDTPVRIPDALRKLRIWQGPVFAEA
jgi:4-diphosphocytidyl-2-C-methyl-D-erythritol kinase